MKKIHYHSHAGFFSGAENMLVNFFSHPEITDNYNVSFSYVYSKKYEDGLMRRVKSIPASYRVNSPSSFNYMSGRAGLIARLFRFILRSATLVPFFIYESVILYRLFRKIDPDVVHINNSGYPSSTSARIAAISAKLARVPCILMIVNNMAVDYRRPSRLLDFPLDKLVAYSVDKFITGSCAAGEQLKRVLRLKEDKHRAIHNGVIVPDISETKYEVKTRLGLDDFNGVFFGVVSMLKPNKGHKILLESISQIVEQDVDAASKIKILIEGDGPMFNELQSLIYRLNLSNNCILVGHEKNIVDFMSFIDVLILPSIEYEDFPNVVIEAMSLGKPVISSALAGTPEQVVSGLSGILVEPGSSKDLALAIVKMYSNYDMIAKMGAEGKRLFENNFTAKIAVNKYLKLYRELS
jgi:glycosyltransferase involved in cell wall biosynthesis